MRDENTPKISVLIAAFQVEREIQILLQSLLHSD